MVGVILAGGTGTRLLPATQAMNKHMIPLLNYPMILYPIETLKSLGVKEVLIVTGGNHLGAFADFLKDGSECGVNLTYRVQTNAGGIAQALGLARDFANGEEIVVILGDNIFEGVSLPEDYDHSRALIYLKETEDAKRFGVYLDGKIVEKPQDITNGQVVTGLYIYPHDVFDVIATLKPSARGELEITDVNNYYLSQNRCDTSEVNSFWSDAGTPASLLEATKWAYGQQIANAE